MQKPFRLAKLVAEPGSLACGWVPMWEFMDGNPLHVGVMILHGRRPGETIYIGAGIHGTEINPVVATIRAIRSINPDQVCGTVVAVPVQNPQGYRVRERLYQFEHQMDGEVLNLHRLFPGDAKGGPHERMVGVLYGLMKESGATFHFDLHTGSRGAENPAHTYLPPETAGAATEQAFQAAKAFNAGFIIREISDGEGVVYARPKMHHVALAHEGIPVLGAELGAGGVLDPKQVDIGRNGILNVLRHRGVLDDGVRVSLVDQPILKKVTNVRANRGGLLFQRIRCGDWVEAGQVIAEIENLFGDVVEEVKATVSGYVMGMTVFPAAHEGERICRIGQV